MEYEPCTGNMGQNIIEFETITNPTGSNISLLSLSIKIIFVLRICSEERRTIIIIGAKLLVSPWSVGEYVVLEPLLALVQYHEIV